MKITIVQPATMWENKAGNLMKISDMLTGIFGKTDLVVLPEMFSTGFSMNPEQLGEEFKSTTYHWMLKIAKNGNFAICGSFIVKQNDKFFNRWIFVTPENNSSYYDKRHLFAIGKEDKKYTRGTNKNIVNYKGFRINPIICYDLRFPVWVRNKGDYDVLICVANWPENRRETWSTLLKARAIENQCFVIGVNRVGNDEAGFKYAGDSVILDPRGRTICHLDEYKECFETGEISLIDLQNFRTTFPVLHDADDFEIFI